MKPVLVIRMPSEIKIDQFDEARKIISQNDDLKKDYHVFFTKDAWTGGKIEFECVNSNATEMELRELQEKIFELIKTQP